MGYKRKRMVYKLDFDGTDYEGLSVKVTGLNTGEYLEIVGLGASKGDSEEAAVETDGMIQLFARHLISWNLEDENDAPVPPTYEGVKANDLAMNLFIVNAWTEAIGNASKDTGKELTAGANSLVASIPTETL